jgi:hypothetical protein
MAVVSGPSGVCHCSELIAVCSVSHVAWLLSPKESPVAIQLRCKIVEMSEVTALFSSKLGQGMKTLLSVLGKLAPSTSTGSVNRRS